MLSSLDSLYVSRSIQLLPSAARNGTQTSQPIDNPGFSAAYVIINTTAVPGVQTLAVSVEIYDAGADAWVQIFADSAQAATGRRIFLFKSGVTAAAPVTAAIAFPLTERFRVVVTQAGGASNFTYSLGVSLIK
jgi:hypothetical protein